MANMASNRNLERKRDGRNIVGNAKSEGGNEVSVYSGALPHPDHVRIWQENVPNGAERILAMTEREIEHRHEMEKREMAIEEAAHPKSFSEAKRGQYLAGAINVFGIGCATYLGSVGATWPAIVIGGFCAVMLSASYMQPRNK